MATIRRGNDNANSISGDNGVDTIYGFGANDTLAGRGGNDQLWGQDGDDLLVGGLGNDDLKGGFGIDTVAYYDAVGKGVVVDLTAETANGGAGSDRLSSIEHVRGSNFGDRLFGSEGNNDLRGYLGNDTLDGRAGSDELTGDEGNDLLIGGRGRDFMGGDAGADTFRFDDGDTRSGGERDVIRDFSRGEGDTIDLSLIDAVAGGADNSFTFIGTADFTGTGQLRYYSANGDTFVQGNNAAGLSADFQIELDKTLINLVRGDFDL